MNPKDKKKIQDKIEQERDFIYCPRLNNSLKIFMDSYPDGVEDDRIAKVLLLENNEVDNIFMAAIRKIRKKLKINVRD
ncbi:MAG TPA: hypothetical protein VI911_11615 [Patescibacteria group bacterium]|nr:hypothetical protein [Patescibacteria group bacterium]